MAMLDRMALRYGFRAHLNSAVPDFASLVSAGRLATQNRGFDPPGTGELWAIESLFPTAEIKVSTGLIESLGRIQYEIVMPSGQGIESAEALAKELAEALEAGTHVAYGSGSHAYVDRAERLLDRPVGAKWNALPVSVVWRAYTATAV